MNADLTGELAAGLQTTLADVSSGRDGVALLVSLLQGRETEALACVGLVALLDGVRTRLDLACDGLQDAAFQLRAAP